MGGDAIKRKMTLTEFYKYAEEQEGRWEFINGVPVALASPSSIHQDISMELSGILYSFFKGKRCTPRATCDVKLFNNRDDIRIPDLLVFCDKNMDDGKKLNGAPTLTIEIWSPSNRSWEQDRKRSEYKEAGVGEIWEVNPDTKSVRVWNLNMKGDYTERDFLFGSDMPSEVFKGLVFNLEDFI